MPKHLTHAQIMTQLDPSDPATIQRLIDHRRAYFGDARMEADATSDDSHGDEVSEGREDGADDERLGEGGKKAQQAERDAAPPRSDEPTPPRRDSRSSTTRS